MEVYYSFSSQKHHNSHMQSVHIAEYQTTINLILSIVAEDLHGQIISPLFIVALHALTLKAFTLASRD